MKSALKQAAVLLLITSAAMAQTRTTVASSSVSTAAKPARRSATAKPAYATQQDLQSLRDMLLQQQQLLEQMQQQIQERDQKLRQTHQQLAEAQAAVREAQLKAASLETSINDRQTTITQLQGDLSDVKLNMTNAATSTQEDQKRIGAVEGLLNRFRFNGDVRVRYENFLQDAVADRHRFRMRIRFGVDGKLTEDFTGGFYLASGSSLNGFANYNDPVSTNQTLTDFFERKAIGIDRAFVQYNPTYAKWLKLTGGKFAFSWIRTPLTFDNDLNPEGFSQQIVLTKLDSAHVKNLTLTGMQLLFRESGSGNDSFAAGGQISGHLTFGPVSMTPSASFINWRNADPIVAARTTREIPTDSSTTILGGNAVTNRLNAAGTGFFSQFLYSDYILDTNIKTPWARWPVRVLAEFEKNLNARTDQAEAFWGEASVGQLKNKGDLQFGYGFARVEQDAIISLFAESDLRQQTNVTQHRIFGGVQIAPNTTFSVTQWVGRQLDWRLVPGRTAPEPWLKRMQVDVVYKF